MLIQKAITMAIGKWNEHIRQYTNIPVRLILQDGQFFDFGEFQNAKVNIRANDLSVFIKLLQGGLDTLGEAYVEGKIDVDGEIDDIIEAAYSLASIPSAEPSKLARLLGMTHSHTKEEDRAAISYHYDVSNQFYARWLDKNMVYSCAYFENGDEDLDKGQIAKLDHILNKIQVKPGNTLLDIGCGWGALVIRAATQFGARCVGITLSKQQFDYATARVKALGLDGQIEIRLQDYRDVDGQFDRVTSVGMFEHVGLANLTSYFEKVHSLLKDDGVAMNHGITSTTHDSGSTPYGGGDFIDKYVFPQGELPHLSLAIKSMQKAGLEVFDVENLRRHYARTLALWSRNFELNTDDVKRDVGEKRYRIWRVYLAACRYAFEVDNVSIFQTVVRKAGRNASNLPSSRNYMYRDLKDNSGVTSKRQIVWALAPDTSLVAEATGK